MLDFLQVLLCKIVTAGRNYGIWPTALDVVMQEHVDVPVDVDHVSGMRASPGFGAIPRGDSVIPWCLLKRVVLHAFIPGLSSPV